MAATIFRLTGFDTEGGNLELSAAHLYAGTERADLGATISASHTPIAGVLSNLADGNLSTTCCFAAEDVYAPGFYIQWTLTAAAEVSRVRLATGDDAAADTRRVTLGAAGSRAPRTWSGLQTTSRREWYAEEPAPLAARLPLTAEVIESSSTSATCALPANCTPGDYILAFVMHRSVLTTPSGWTLLRQVGPVKDSGSTQQWQTLLGKVASSDDFGGSLTVMQASAGRLILGVVGIDTKGAAVTTQVVSDAAMRVTNQYIDALPATVPTGSVAVASATSIAIATAGGAWTYMPQPPETTPLFGATEGLDRRLVAAISAGGGVFGPRFIAPLVAAGSEAAITKITVTVHPSVASPVLKEGPLALRTTRSSAPRTVVGESLPQGVGAVSNQTSVQVRDTEFGGAHKVYGTVARKNTPTNVPLRRRVRLHRSRDGLLVRETWSENDGTYEFLHIAGQYEYDVIAWDHQMSYRSVVANNLTPEAM